MEARPAPVAAARGKNDVNRIDYSFDVDWDAPVRTAGWRSCRGERGSPLDKLISELMIHVNNTWGRLLAERGAAGLYRAQAAGKVKMSTRPGEHQGSASRTTCGRARRCAATATSSTSASCSPCSRATQPPYGDNDAELFAALADFEATYSNTPNSRTGWSTTGACAGCCRRTSPSVGAR